MGSPGPFELEPFELEPFELEPFELGRRRNWAAVPILRRPPSRRAQEPATTGVGIQRPHVLETQEAAYGRISTAASEQIKKESVKYGPAKEGPVKKRPVKKRPVKRRPGVAAPHNTLGRQQGFSQIKENCEQIEWRTVKKKVGGQAGKSGTRPY